eukprot:1888051-Amphidinium_carterae.1
MDSKELGHSQYVRLVQSGRHHFGLVHDGTGERIQLELGEWLIGYNLDDMAVLSHTRPGTNTESIVYANDLLSMSLHETLEEPKCLQVRTRDGRRLPHAELQQEAVVPNELVVQPTPAVSLHLLVFKHRLPVQRCLFFFGLSRLADYLFGELSQQAGFVAKRIPQLEGACVKSWS